MKNRNWIVALLLSLVFAGCGGGGGGGSSAPAPATPESLTGTYKLTGFTLIFPNGTTVTEHSSIVTSWGGSMEIGPTTVKQTVMLNGKTTTGTWAYTVSWSSATSGTIYTNTNNVTFTLSGGAMTTTSSDADGTEYDYWQKTSPNYTIKSVEREGEPEAMVEGFILIGNGLK